MVASGPAPFTVTSVWFGQVRQNARQSRNAITGELWEAVNDSWIQIEELLAKPVPEQRVGEAVADEAPVWPQLKIVGLICLLAGTSIGCAVSRETLSPEATACGCSLTSRCTGFVAPAGVSSSTSSE